VQEYEEQFDEDLRKRQIWTNIRNWMSYIEDLDGDLGRVGLCDLEAANDAFVRMTTDVVTKGEL
jgi:hypothetical protein